MRHLWRCALVLLLVIPASAVTRTAEADCKSGDRDFVLPHAGLPHDGRLYWVHVPPAYCEGGEQPTAVVLNLHGGGGNWRSAQSSTRMDEHADREGYLVVFPQGTGPIIHKFQFGTWNAGRCCGQASEQQVDDVGYIARVLDDLGRNFKVDWKRVYATGLSNGAMMSYRLACELSARFAAIAPVAGVGVFTKCPLERPVPTLHFHGTADLCEPYEGKALGGCWERLLSLLLKKDIEPGEPIPVDAVPSFMYDWRVANHVFGDGHITFQHGSVTCVTHADTGRSDMEVGLCTIHGGGHTWPGGTYGNICQDYPDSRACGIYQEVMGSITDDIDATAAMWEFFTRHPKP